MQLAAKTIFLSRRSRRNGCLGNGLCVPIIVPEAVESYADVSQVVSQIKPLEGAVLEAGRFGFSALPSLENRVLALAYFLGVMAGDMSKHAQYGKGRHTMTVLLQLSKRYDNNLRFGDFVTFCAQLLGIPMKRIKDFVRPAGAPYDAYRWESRRSELLMWMFEACLGLRDRETTTDCPIRAEWLRRTPQQFKTWFLQGVADSDGYVDLNKHEIGIVIDPNEFLIATLLSELNVQFRSAVIKEQATVLMSVKEGFNLPVFNPIVRTHKFELARRLAQARRFRGPWPGWLRMEVDHLVGLGEPPGKIVLTVLEKYNVAIRSQHLTRSNVKNAKREVLMPRAMISEAS